MIVMAPVSVGELIDNQGNPTRKLIVDGKTKTKELWLREDEIIEICKQLELMGKTKLMGGSIANGRDAELMIEAATIIRIQLVQIASLKKSLKIY